MLYLLGFRLDSTVDAYNSFYDGLLMKSDLQLSSLFVPCFENIVLYSFFTLVFYSIFSFLCTVKHLRPYSRC